MHTPESLIALVTLLGNPTTPLDLTQAHVEGWHWASDAGIAGNDGTSWAEHLHQIADKALGGSDYHITALRHILHGGTDGDLAPGELIRYLTFGVG